jgi:hypothetical protein
MVVNFIGGGNWSALRKLPTCRKSLTNFVTYCCIEYTSPWTGFELTKLIGTEYTGSCKSNYHTITTMTTPDHFEFFIMGEWLLYDKYRLMHALFHIRIVIIPIWKNACINLFITYFSIELKTTKLTSHTHTHTHKTMSDWYQLRDDNSPDMEKGMHCSIYKEAWYHVIRVLPWYLSMGWYRCGTLVFT